MADVRSHNRGDTSCSSRPFEVIHLAWFSRKKEDGEGGDETGGDGLAVDPLKARPWFDRAKVTADTRNYEYAITCYLTGIKWDPTNLEMHENLLEVAGVFRSSGGKPASSKDIKGVMGDKKRPIDKFVGAELAWVRDAMNPALALKAMQAANEVGLSEVAYWIGERGMRAAAHHKKPTKAMFVSLMNEFETCGGWDKAVECGHAAMRLDNTDSKLEGHVRNLSAQATMDRGRYDEGVNEEGGFRSSIKDAEAQKAITEEDSLAVGEEAEARRLARAREAWEEKPTATDRIQKFAELLRKSGKEDLEKEAIKVYYRGYKDTDEYRFRMLAGDIQLMLDRRRLRKLEARAEETEAPEDREKAEEARVVLLQKEAQEYQERTENYPTDLGLRFELGKRLYALKQFDEAIPVLQLAAQDARFRAKTQHLIGKCFLEKEWFDEAVESLREATNAYEIKDDDRHLEMRYDLMDALERYANDNDDLDAAEEANKIASGIALKQLNFRDIGARRDTLRALVKKLKKG